MPRLNLFHRPGPRPWGGIPSGVVLVLIVVLAACQGSLPAATVPDTPTPSVQGAEEAFDRDAQTYATQMGIDLEEARQRLGYEPGIGELNAALQANEADTFAGLWIEHQPTYRIVVAFTRDGEQTIRPYLEGRPFAHLVEIEEARFTMAELEAILSQTQGELEKLDFGVAMSIHVQKNRVEVPVGDRAWFESELDRVGAALPEGVELIEVEGGSTAQDKDRLLTPPVPGIAFPRQKPTEGFRECMEALLIGTLQLEDGCLYVRSLQGEERVLPIWPPEFTLRTEGEQVLVIDAEGQVAARVGEEVSMGGGHVPLSDEWVLGQIPPACRGDEYFIVGCEVRPNLMTGATLLDVDQIVFDGRTLLFLRAKPALDEQMVGSERLTGKLVSYDYRRCLHLQTESGPGSYTLLWPAGWSVQVADGRATVVDEAGQAMARLGDTVSLRGRPVPQTMESPVYSQLIAELPGDCVGASWVVDGIE